VPLADKEHSRRHYTKQYSLTLTFNRRTGADVSFYDLFAL